MSKKHYERIAEIIRQHCEDLENSPFLVDNSLPRKLADYFSKENPKFDKSRFLKACGV